ncbi:hypothetical protein [Leptolyngbya sp. 7M]|uniref:hypothetical protein n=1 Tax=Leptolyngbya sp. 7M TaxID=2812896 RepID=UPI001B8C007F|nr:hypothetical protein [Leptolyngbya sp. 7M]QYO62547.1 hypothetical protein JVX88_21100 [Leptolyngbya sp. 7M]
MATSVKKHLTSRGIPAAKRHETRPSVRICEIPFGSGLPIECVREPTMFKNLFGGRPVRVALSEI